LKFLEKKVVFFIGTVLLLCLFSSIQFNFMDNSFMGDNKQNFQILKISNSVINVTTPENITYTAPMEGYYPGTFGFETDAIGESQPMMFNNSYALDCNGSVIAEIDGHKKVFNVSDNNAVGSAVVMQRFNEAGFDNQTYGTIEYWFRVEPGNALKNTEFRLNWGYGKDDAAIVLRVYGAFQQWQFNNGTWNQIPNIPDPLNNTWHHIRINFRCLGALPYLGLQENKFEILIDGISSVSLNFYTSTTEIAMFIPMYTQAGGYKDNYAYCDAIGYSWDSNYNIGDNLKEGLLLSFETFVNLNKIWYALDSHNSGTILGNTSIPMPSVGIHTIQVYGKNLLGAIFFSDTRYFSVKDPITIITPENKTYSEPMSGYFPASYGFENDISGSWPINWTIDATNLPLGGNAQVLDTLDNHHNIVELYDTVDGSGRDVRATKTFDNGAKYGDIELWLRTDVIAKDSVVEVRNSSLGVVFSVQIRLGHWMDNLGAILQKASGGDMDDPIDNNWYHIRMAFETTNEGYEGLNQWEWKAWINGVESYVRSFKDNFTNIDQIRIRTKGTENNYHTYFDAVGYSWDPNYNTGDNLNEGLLLSYKSFANLNTTWYSLDGLDSSAIFGNITIPMPSDGIHTIQVLGNDSIGRLYESDVLLFSIDVSPPIIIINSPSPDFYGIIAPNFNLNIIETNLNLTWYTLNDGIINPFSGFSGTINQTEWDKFVNELITIKFYANDSGDHLGMTQVTVEKDINAPTSSISFELHASPNIVNESTLFTLSVNDGSGSGVSVIRYKINDSSWIDYTVPFDLSSYANGYYTITYQAEDNVGNIETEKSIIVELRRTAQPSEPIISGFDLLLISCIFSIVSIILIKKKYRNFK